MSIGGPRNYEFKDGNQILVIPKYDSDRDDGQYICSAAQFYSFETVAINVTGYGSFNLHYFSILH